MRRINPVVATSIVAGLILGALGAYALPQPKPEYLAYEIQYRFVMGGLLTSLAVMVAGWIIHEITFSGACAVKETFFCPFTSDWRINFVRRLVKDEGCKLKPLNFTNFKRWLRIGLSLCGTSIGRGLCRLCPRCLRVT